MLDFLDLQYFAVLRGRRALHRGISVLFGSGMMKKLVWSDGLRKRMTLIELLVVVAIMAVLMSMTLPYLRSVGTQTRTAIAKSQLKALSTALEAYQSAQGYYPVDSGRVQGADIPEFLFAGLHNLPTPSLGGGGEVPFYDPEAKAIGLLNGRDDSDVNGEKYQQNADPLGQIEHSSAGFQMAHKPRLRTGKSLIEAKGLPVIIDPWGNAYHYREWASKRQDWATKAAQGPAGPDACMNPGGFDLWSNGPDGINNFGDPDSDDIVLTGE